MTTIRMTAPERMRKVLELRYLEGMTLQQVAEIMGVTRERVRQIEAKAIRILRNKSEFREQAVDLLRELDNV
jgi:RNA polymerase primary sigma factor